jgi:hypothetical protein
VIAEVLALKEVAVKAAGTVTDDGAVRAELVLVRVITPPPAGAGCDRLIVQVLAELGPRLVGLHTREDSRTEVVRLRVVFAALPLYVAVMVALELPPRAAVVAVKLAELAAAAIVTEAGTVSKELVLAKVRTAPPAGAGWDKATVQVVEAFGPRLVGLQDREETSAKAARVTVVLAELLL